jgi:hypothetical protein
MTSAPNPHAFWRRIGAAVAVPLLLVAACSLPADERVTPYDPNGLPPELVEPTTTTTELVESTTTSEPNGSLPEPETTTTTIAPPDTSLVTVYYAIGLTDQMQAFRRAIPFQDVPIQLVVDLLESPTGIAEFNLRSSVRAGMILDVTIDRATATVELDPVVLDRMTDAQQRRAIAQIVLTFTSFATADQGNIGLVRFAVDGAGYAVFVPKFGGSSDPGESLAFADFSDLVVSTPVTPTGSSSTTSTTTATTTTGPSPGTTEPG